MNLFNNIYIGIILVFLAGCQQKKYQIAPHPAEQEGVTPGKYIPYFKAIDSSNNYIDVEQAMGKATIIDFWASWCRPCRESANPAYKKLYEKYHSKGLNILGVSSDRHQYYWKKALREDSLPWIQIIDSTHQILKQFQVKSIPTMLLIDQNGKITGRNLWGKDLEYKIDSLLYPL